MNKPKRQVLVCGGGGCISSGCEEIKNTLLAELRKWNLDREIEVVVTGCMGPCSLGPMMIINPQGTLYNKLKPEDVCEIVEQHLKAGRIVERLLLNNKKEIKEIPFFAKQVRVVLKNVGVIDPEDIRQYIAKDGYSALTRVLEGMKPAKVIEVIKDSGLRGRGGAGFPTGMKWELAAKNTASPKYVICNADEGDPGAYMDRSVIEGDPHSLIEGMIIGGYAIGANQGIVYIRAEYPLAVERLEKAITQCREKGYLGKDILSSGFDFDIEVRVGAGAFVCGEETALIHSIEGKRGEPKPKPPFPADKGLWDQPTVINNVETWANIAPVILNGAQWFRSMGTEKSPGTKVFALAGNIKYSGLVEVPIGTTLGEILFEIGGGIPGGKKFKAAQTGGPSGGCIPAEHLNVPMDFDDLTKLGTIMGSGGLIVMDEDTCMVNLAKFFLEFVQEESCGKCVPCRVGTKRMLEILERIIRGEGREGDIERLLTLGEHIKDTALCGLGQTAPNPVLSTIRYFRHEYEEHIRNKHCSASACAALFVAPCQNACPAGVDVPRYIEAVQRQEYHEAVEIIREDNPFPAVCGRVCTHPCESVCQRGQLDEPVGIRALKRFAGDYELRHRTASIESVKKAMAQVTPNGRKIAIIGSGPAGLTAAYYLAKWGYKVQIIEEMDVLGGKLTFSIPSYRLPKDILVKEIEWIIAHGIEYRLNTRIEGEDALNELIEDNDVVLLAIGSQKDVELNISGEKLPDVITSSRFLQNVNLGQEVNIGKRVAVIGGGESAIDSARVARRLGAEDVSIIYRRTRESMPADRDEVEEAEKEGISIYDLSVPVRIIEEKGRVVGIECVRMENGRYDKTGRRVSVPIEGSEYIIGIDMVITSLGQDTEGLVFEKDLHLGKGKDITINRDTMMTSIPGVFAAGDCVQGPENVIQAIADGKKAARRIDEYLGGSHYQTVRKIPTERKPYLEIIEQETGRVAPRRLEPSERINCFKQIEMTYSEKEAKSESCRCLRCDVK